MGGQEGKEGLDELGGGVGSGGTGKSLFGDVVGEGTGRVGDNEPKGGERALKAEELLKPEAALVAKDPLKGEEGVEGESTDESSKP